MRTIDINKIDMEDFETSYKKAFSEKADNEKVEILFDLEGNWAGHAWGNNCFYSTSDMEANGDYRLSDDAELSLSCMIQAWECTG